MTLFKKGKGDQGGGTPKAPAFSPIDRVGLLGLLDQVVNGGQSGVLELREPRGNWVYAFQAGALTHASGGRVRGARQAFDLLWEFQSGEFSFTPGPNPSLAGNLYIDKGRLLDLLRRSQAVLQGPSAPYIPPDQQRPIAPANQPYRPPVPGQMPTWPEDDSKPLPEGIEGQTRRVMDNLILVLRGAGYHLAQVVSVRIYLTDFRRHYAPMNEVYRGYFPSGRLPARTCVGVTALARDALVEIDLVARK